MNTFTVVLKNESSEAFTRVIEAYIAKFAPADQVEQDLVLEMATARWRLRRAWAIETSLIDEEMASQCGTFSPAGEDSRIAAAWKTLAAEASALKFLTPYEAKLRSSYTRSLRELMHLRAEFPNEPKPTTRNSSHQRRKPIPSRDRQEAGHRNQTTPLASKP